MELIPQQINEERRHGEARDCRRNVDDRSERGARRNACHSSRNGDRVERHGERGSLACALEVRARDAEWSAKRRLTAHTLATMVAVDSPASYIFEIMNCAPPEMIVALRTAASPGPSPHLVPRTLHAAPIGIYERAIGAAAAMALRKSTPCCTLAVYKQPIV